jgi:surfeit locus 1 family protein
VGAGDHPLLVLVAVPAPRASSARFLLRPVWLLSHLLVGLLIATMVSLGFWQLNRLDERRERNELIESRLDQPTVPVETLLAPGDDDAVLDTVRFREVTATGTYDDDATVVVRNRSQDGSAGAWLVTPLEVEGGTRVGVLRGFVSFTPDGQVVEAPVPEGDVTVEGAVVDPGSFDGTAPRDLAPLLAEDDVLPGLVLAATSTPPEPSAADAATVSPTSLLTVPTPELGDGPHLGYAAQWFIFATIGAVGYPLVLRRVVARRGMEVDDDLGPAGPDGDPGRNGDGTFDELVTREG